MAIPATIGQAAGLASSLASKAANAPPKTWRDRLKPAAYVSPVTNTRIKFDFGDLSRGFTIRGTAFDFAGVDDSYVQQDGYGQRKYPLACIFSGGQCDLLATQFEKVLLEPGIGKLEHPIYGTVPVVPLGDVERVDALKTAANQSVVTLTFYTTLAAVYPQSSTSALNEISGALTDFNLAVATAFAGGVPNLKGISNVLSAIATIRKTLKSVRKSLERVSDSVASIRKGFQSAIDAVNEGLDTFIGTPLLLAQQISNLIQAPGRALVGIESRLDSYAALANTIFGSGAGSPGAVLSAGSTLLAHKTKVANDFHIANLFALNAVAGSVVSVIAQPVAAAFPTRSRVIAAAAALTDQLDALNVWREQGFKALADAGVSADAQIDTGEAYAALQRVVALTAGHLIQASFDVRPESKIILDRARTILDLSAELYRSVDDDKLNLLINTNNLTGDELLELPKGRRIVYYPS